MFRNQMRREWLSMMRSRDEVLNPLVFLFLGVTLFAMGFGGDAKVLGQFSPGIVWVLVLLANLLSLEAMFRRDFEDGSLEQLVLLADPPFLPVLAKVTAQWCVTGLAMTILAPVIALMLNMPVAALPMLMVCLLLGTPTLSLLGAVGAALTVGLRRGGVLLALLVLPFYIPVLIFGVSGVLNVMSGIETMAQIYWLAAISMLALTMAPFAIVQAIRISVEQS
jgi:heme exporter protein B